MKKKIKPKKQWKKLSEFHDDLLNTLISVKLEMDVLAQNPVFRKPEARKTLSKLSDRLRHCISGLHSLHEILFSQRRTKST